MKDKGFRVSVDDRDEKLGFKIREAQVEKSILLSCWRKEVASNTVSVRKRDLGDQGRWMSRRLLTCWTTKCKQEHNSCKMGRYRGHRPISDKSCKYQNHRLPDKVKVERIEEVKTMDRLLKVEM